MGALVLAGDIGHAVMGGSGDIGVIDLREGPVRADEATEFVELQFFFGDLFLGRANAVAEVDQEDALVEQALHGGRVFAQVAPGGELCQSRANALGVDQEDAAGGGCFGDVAFEFFQAGDAALGKVVDDRDRLEFLFEMANAAPGGVGLGEELMAAELTGDARLAVAEAGDLVVEAELFLGQLAVVRFLAREARETSAEFVLAAEEAHEATVGLVVAHEACAAGVDVVPGVEQAAAFRAERESVDMLRDIFVSEAAQFLQLFEADGVDVLEHLFVDAAEGVVQPVLSGAGLIEAGEGDFAARSAHAAAVEADDGAVAFDLERARAGQLGGLFAEQVGDMGREAIEHAADEPHERGFAGFVGPVEDTQMSGRHREVEVLPTSEPLDLDFRDPHGTSVGQGLGKSKVKSQKAKVKSAGDRTSVR